MVTEGWLHRPSIWKSQSKQLQKPKISRINCTPDYKIADEQSTFTAYFAELTNTDIIETEHYKTWTQIDFEEDELWKRDI